MKGLDVSWLTGVMEEWTAPVFIHVRALLSPQIDDGPVEPVVTKKHLSLAQLLGRISQEIDHLGKMDMCIVFTIFPRRSVKQAHVL